MTVRPLLASLALAAFAVSGCGADKTNPSDTTAGTSADTKPTPTASPTADTTADEHENDSKAGVEKTKKLDAASGATLEERLGLFAPKFGKILDTSAQISSDNPNLSSEDATAEAAKRLGTVTYTVNGKSATLSDHETDCAVTYATSDGDAETPVRAKCGSDNVSEQKFWDAVYPQPVQESTETSIRAVGEQVGRTIQALSAIEQEPYTSFNAAGIASELDGETPQGFRVSWNQKNTSLVISSTDGCSIEVLFPGDEPGGKFTLANAYCA